MSTPINDASLDRSAADGAQLPEARAEPPATMADAAPARSALASSRSSQRPTSLSLQSRSDGDEPLNPLFPSPSSAFSPPPVGGASEADVIKGLLAHDRARRQSEAASRGALGIDPSTAVARQRKRSSSMSGLMDGAARSLEDESGPMSPPPVASTSMAKSSSRHSSRRGSQPTRPPSEQYMSRLSRSSLSNDNAQQRLSASISRRESARARASVLVRDFAFASDDPRHVGQRLDGAPSTRTSLMSQPSPSTLTGVWEESDQSEGSGGSHSWGFVTSHGGALADDPFPIGEAEDDEATVGGNLEIPEGGAGALFVSIYGFEAEAAQEMSLREGEVVRVFERVCEGWVVAGRVDADDETGLVPENYLAPYDAPPTSSDDGFDAQGEDEPTTTLSSSTNSTPTITTEDVDPLARRRPSDASASDSSSGMHVGIGPGGRRMSVASAAISFSSDVEAREPAAPANR